MALLTNRDGSTMSLAQAKSAMNTAREPYHSHTYIPVGTTTTSLTTTPGTPIKVTLDVNLKENYGFSVFDLGLPTQALQFDGVNQIADVLFSLESTSSITSSINNVTPDFMLYVNGVYEPGNIITRKIGTGADVGALSITGTFRCSAGDLLEIYIDSDIAATFDFSKTSIVIEEIKEV